MYFLAGIGTSLGYHRILTHECVEIKKWAKYFLVLVGLPAGTPVQWVGIHRAHHAFSDRQNDPHSPILNGFWYAHCGWYIHSKNPLVCFLYAIAGPIRMFIDSFLRPRTNLHFNHLASDIQSDRFFSFLSRPLVYTSFVLIYLFLILLIPFILFGYTGIWAASITLIVIYNIGDSVDSIGHLFGQKRGMDGSRNNIILGILAFGDGWHSNHHLSPKKAKHGTLKGQFDLGFVLIRVGKSLGIIKKIY